MRFGYSSHSFLSATDLSRRRRWTSGFAGLAALLALASLLAGCASAAQTSTAATGGAAGKRPTVVATTTIIADMAQNVAGDNAEVVSLLPRGADPHTFQPNPRDSQTLARAAVILENGAGFESWLNKLVESSGTQAKRVAVSNGAKLLTMDAQGHESAAPGDGRVDPHLWLDVANGMLYVENIRDALAAADPAHADSYRANAARYLDELKALDNSIVQQVGSIPRERRKLVTNHDTFGYFAARYGFDVVGAVIPSLSPEAQPSAQDIARLVETVRQTGVGAVFAENTVSPRLAEQIARDSGAQVVGTLYTDSLGESGSAGDSYSKMMRYDVDEIVKALK
ncbi:MAG: zinc ABC transporter substrate-binding protein [Anaerolineae bacterium]